MPFNTGNAGSIPGGEVKILHASGAKKPEHKQQMQHCNKFNEDFKNGSHFKNVKNPEGWDGEGGGGGRFRMGNTCTPMVESCQCMAKPIQYCKV